MGSVHIETSEWESLQPEPNSRLYGLSLEDPLARQTAKELTESGKVEISELLQGLSIRTNSYVGRISLGSVQITIKPKISGMPLLSLFRYAYRFRDLSLLSFADQVIEDCGFVDILVFQLIAEIRNLYSRNLHRKYVPQQQALASPRGRIDLQKIALRRGAVETTLPCQFYPRLTNCLANQILLAGLYLAIQSVNLLSLKVECRRLAALLSQDVDNVRLDREKIRQLERESNRLTIAYNPSIEIIKILLESKGVALDGEEAYQRLPGFLFDMNRFFQTLISRFLHENLSGYFVHDEYRLKGMLSYMKEFNPCNRRTPEPRPDFVIQKESKPLAILDAKYRDLWAQPLPREMLYQLAIYAMSQVSRGKAIILYPTLAESAKDARIQINDPVHGNALGEVVLRPVNLLRVNSLLTDRHGFSVKKQRAEYAEALVFG